MRPKIDLYSAKLHGRINVLVLVLAVVAIAALLLTSARGEISSWVSMSVPQSFHSVLRFFHAEQRSADPTSDAHKGAAADQVSTSISGSRLSTQRTLATASNSSTSTLEMGIPHPAAQAGPRAANTAATFSHASATGIGVVANSNSIGAKPSAPDAILAAKVWNDSSTDFNAAGSWIGGSPAGNNVARFDAAVGTFQPTLTADISTSGTLFSMVLP